MLQICLITSASKSKFCSLACVCVFVYARMCLHGASVCMILLFFMFDVFLFWCVFFFFFTLISSHCMHVTSHCSAKPSWHSGKCQATVYQRANNRDLSIQSPWSKSWRSESEQSDSPSLPSEGYRYRRAVRHFQLTSSILDQMPWSGRSWSRSFFHAHNLTHAVRCIHGDRMTVSDETVCNSVVPFISVKHSLSRTVSSCRKIFRVHVERNLLHSLIQQTSKCEQYKWLFSFTV